METNVSDTEITKDVLHNEDHSKLTQEEIAKAVAHHKKRHQPEEQNAKVPQSRKQEKPK